MFFSIDDADVYFCFSLQHMKHEYTHIQNHLIADAFANAMGWVSAWVVWWALCIVILLIANFGGFGSSPCNGMHAFPLATVFIGFVVFYLLVYGLRWGRMVCISGAKLPWL